MIRKVIVIVSFSLSSRQTTNLIMRKLITTIMLFMAVTAVSAQENIYSFKVKNDQGKEVSLEQYKGKLLLIVNTATRCGFTPQYKDLEDIYEKFNEKGLTMRFLFTPGSRPMPRTRTTFAGTSPSSWFHPTARSLNALNPVTR